MQTIKSKSGRITIYITGGDPLQGAVQGLVVYFANHLAHGGSSKKNVNLYYSNEDSDYTNSDIENGGIGTEMRRIMSRNGIKLNIINSPHCDEDIGKNEVTLRFVIGEGFDGLSPPTPDNRNLEYGVNYVRTNKAFGQGIKSMKEVAYNAAHEIAHQLFHKAQLFFKGIITNFGDDGQGHFNKKPNLLMDGKYGGFHGSGSVYELLLPGQFNYIHEFLAK